MDLGITLCMAYYENPTMLAFQYEHWRKLALGRLPDFKVIIVDDGSPKNPAHLVPRPPDLPPLKIFRALKDKPWHQNACRNIAAHEADTEWLILTDMDHLLDQSIFRWVLVGGLKSGEVYRPYRLEWCTRTPTLCRKNKPKPHPNTWVMERELYLRFGGYDERTCGYYGTDAFFRDKVKAYAKLVCCRPSEAKVFRVGRDEIADASTTAYPRKDGRPTGMKNKLIRSLAKGSPKFLTHPYKRAL